MDQVNKLKNVDYVLSSQAFDLDLEEFEGRRKNLTKIKKFHK